MNNFLFNNGYHTVHHMSPLRHWSENEVEHNRVASKIDPVLNEKNFGWYMFRVYILGAVFPKFRTDSMRVRRIALVQAGLSQGEQTEQQAASLVPELQVG
jgi:hypothetical protein